MNQSPSAHRVRHLWPHNLLPGLTILGLLSLVAIVLAVTPSSASAQFDGASCSWDVPSNNASEAMTAGSTPIQIYTEASNQCPRAGATIAAGSAFKVIATGPSGWVYVEASYVGGSPSLWGWTQTSDFAGDGSTADCGTWETAPSWDAAPDSKTTQTTQQLASRANDECATFASVPADTSVLIRYEGPTWSWVQLPPAGGGGWMRTSNLQDDDGPGDGGPGDGGPGDGDDGTCPAGWPNSSTNCEFRIVNEDLAFIPGAGTPYTAAQMSIIQDDSDNFAETEVERNDGGFRTRCLTSHFSYADPLVFPGDATNTNAHLHMFFGNTGANADSTNDLSDQSNDDHLLNNDSTCGDLGVHNKSAYWMPALFNGANEVVIPDQINLYYKTVNDGENAYNVTSDCGTNEACDLHNMRPIPNDMTMVSHTGKVQLREDGSDTFLVARVEFKNCIRVDDGGFPERKDFPTAGMDRENYVMQKHWTFQNPQTCGELTGRGADTDGSYVRIPGLEFNVQWKLDTTADLRGNGLTSTNWSFSNGTTVDDLVIETDENGDVVRNDRASFENNGDVPLAGVHGDYMAAWVDNTWTDGDDWTDVGKSDGMSQLVRTTRDSPHDFVFGAPGLEDDSFENSDWEFRNLDRVAATDGRQLAGGSGGKHSSTSGLLDNLTVSQLDGVPGGIS